MSPRSTSFGVRAAEDTETSFDPANGRGPPLWRWQPMPASSPAAPPRTWNRSAPWKRPCATPHSACGKVRPNRSWPATTEIRLGGERARPIVDRWVWAPSNLDTAHGGFFRNHVLHLHCTSEVLSAYAAWGPNMSGIAILPILFALFYVLTFHSYAALANKYIRVATFNIANLGDRDEYKRSLISIANIILETNADILAIQEVEPPSSGENVQSSLGSQQVHRLVDLLNLASNHYNTPKYSAVIAEQYTGDETTAFLFRDPVRMIGSIRLLPHDSDPDEDGSPAFQRVPHIAEFQAENFNFIVVNVHLYTKVEGNSSEGRATELEILSKWLKQQASMPAKNVIVLGDFNRFLNGKGAWKNLYSDDHSEYYRFPLLEAIKVQNPSFDPLNDKAPEDRYSTTTSKSLLLYDQIIITKSVSSKFVSKPCFGEHVGVITFDNKRRFSWFIDTWHHAAALLSDHRPIWIRLRISGSERDGLECS